MTALNKYLKCEDVSDFGCADPAGCYPARDPHSTLVRNKSWRRASPTAKSETPRIESR